MKNPTRSKASVPIFLCLAAILLSTLACKTLSGGPIDPSDPIESDEGVSTLPTTVLGVKVDPPSGSGSFQLEVTYQVSVSSLISNTESIVCRYVGPDGATMLIDTIFPESRTITDSRSRTMSSTLPFTVTGDGEYTATCLTESTGSKASAGFTVQSALTATGQRVWDGLYTDVDPNTFLVSHCASPVRVKLELREDGTAWMQTLGEGRYGAKCEKTYNFRGDTQNMEWILTGVHDSNTKTATFTECNNTPGATGEVSYKDGVITGSATCVENTDPKFSDLKVTITIP
jgi:hypothetical protein